MLERSDKLYGTRSTVTVVSVALVEAQSTDSRGDGAHHSPTVRHVINDDAPDEIAHCKRLQLALGGTRVKLAVMKGTSTQ